jgi:hypothetical protein
MFGSAHWIGIEIEALQPGAIRPITPHDVRISR